MTPRHLNDSEVKRIALEIFRQEALQQKFIGEPAIRLLVGQIFDDKIEPTKGDITAIRNQVSGLVSRLEGVENTVSQTKGMILRLHSFGEVNQPGFFEERAKMDDGRWDEQAERWDELNDNMQKLGIVREAEKIVAANAILEGQKKKELADHRAQWIRWIGTPAIGVAAASAWRILQNIAKTDHAPHWITWLLSLWK